MNINDLNFDHNGLIPAVIQDQKTLQVLMVGWMNEESLGLTFQTGSVHFWSRSRKKIWQKGETSGNYLHVKEIFMDCDQDTLLIMAEPLGPTCHTGNVSCFYQSFSRKE